MAARRVWEGVTAVRAAALPLLLSILSACGSMYGRELRQADAAAKRGDQVAAGQHYRQACQLARSSGDRACVEAKRIAQALRRTALAQAAVPCREGRVSACIQAMEQTRALSGDGPELVSLRNQAGQLHAESCQKNARTLATPKSEIWLTRCVESIEAQIATPSYGHHVRVVEEHGAQVLDQLASATDQPGARALLRDAAVRLARGAPASPRTQRRDALLRSFISEAAIPVQVELLGTAPGGLEVARVACDDARRVLGARVRCGAPPNAPGLLSILASVTLDATRDRIWHEDHSRRYQSGVQRDPNPAYPAAVRANTVAQRALRSTEQERAKARAACQGATSTSQRADRELEDARRRADEAEKTKRRREEQERRDREQERRDRERRGDKQTPREQEPEGAGVTTADHAPRAHTLHGGKHSHGSESDLSAARRAALDAETERATRCRERDEVETLWKRRQREAKAAAEHLDRTPSLIETPLFDLYNWQSTHREWRASYRFDLLRADGRPAQTQTGDGVVQLSSVAQAGFGPARVPTLSPRATPSDKEMALAALDQVLPRALAALRADLSHRVATRRGACPEDRPSWEPTWLQCHAETQLWSTGKISAARLIAGE